MATETTPTDPTKVDQNIPKGFFTYPMDIQEGAPFIYLGAYPYKSLVDSTEYTASIRDVKTRDYVAEFAFYVPKSLKFSYNPQIEQVAARIDPKLVKGLQGGYEGAMKDVIKGSVSTGVNYLAASNKLDSALSVGLEAFKQWSQITKGQIFDPKQLNMFKDAPFMSYTLTYRFVPESTAEANHIDFMLKILRMLSQAVTAGSQNLQQIFNLNKDLSNAAGEVDKANADVTEAEKIKQYAGKFSAYYFDTLKEDDPTRKRAEGDYKEKLKNLSDGGKGMPQNLKAAAEKFRPSAPAEKGTYAEKWQQATELYGKLQLLAKETWSAVLEARMDVWIHPHLFDLYLVIPPTDTQQKSTLGIESSDTFKTINSKSEIDMYRGAKGLILSGLDISFIESPNRDDIPFNTDRLPAGWEVNMTFTSVSKTTRS